MATPRTNHWSNAVVGFYTFLCLGTLGLRTASALPPPVCPGDTNGDLVVNFADVTATLAQWGNAGPSGDSNADGSVNFLDVTVVLANWGMTCPMPRIETPGAYVIPPSLINIDPDGLVNYPLDPTFPGCAGGGALEFQTDGPIICQALFQRLAPRSSQYGAGLAPSSGGYFFPGIQNSVQDQDDPWGGKDPPIMDEFGGLGTPWWDDPWGGKGAPVVCFPEYDWMNPDFGNNLADIPGMYFHIDDIPKRWPKFIVPQWKTLYFRVFDIPEMPGDPWGGKDPPIVDYRSGRWSPLPGVNRSNGETVLCSLDLAIPGRGLDLVWARTYRSRLSPEGARLGHGWDHSYNIFVEAIGPDLVLHDGGGRADRYFRQPDGTWTASEFFRVIARNPDQTHTVVFRHGTRWILRALDGSAAQGRVKSIVDRNGNTMGFTYDAQGRLIGVQDTLHNPPTTPRVLTFAYNADGRIETVTDWTGRQVYYDYYAPADPNGAAGDLRSVRSPVVFPDADYPFPPSHAFPTGLTTTYRSSRGFADDRLNHNLLSITDPNGQTPFSAVYAATTNASDLDFDRCQRLTVGPGPSFNSIDLHWTIVTPAPVIGAPRILCIVNDRAGNVREYSYDALNRLVRAEDFTGRAPTPDSPTTHVLNRPDDPVRLTDPPAFVSTIEYNADALPTRVVRPELDEVVFAYDSANPLRRSQGNVLSITRLPGPRGGDQPQRIATFTSEPGHNFIGLFSDLRGNTTQYQYDANGNRVQTIHRIPTIVEDWTYNAFGQATSHTWPDNGSGHRRRDDFLYYSGASGYQNGRLHQVIADAASLALTHSYEYDRVGNLVRAIDPTGLDSLRVVDQINRPVTTRSRSLLLPFGPTRYSQDTFYDATGNIIRVEVDNINALGETDFPARFTFNVSYDVLNRPVESTRQVDAFRSVINLFEYDANGNLSRLFKGEAANGNDPFNTLEFSYDERDLLFRVVGAPGSPVQSTTQFDFDANANIARIASGIEGPPHETVYAYDGYDRLVSRTDAMGNVSLFNYDENSNVILRRRFGELTDLIGDAGNTLMSQVLRAFDAMDRCIREEASFFDPATGVPYPGDPRVTLFTLSDFNRTMTATDSLGRTTAFTYDTTNRLQSVTDPLGNSAAYSYDQKSNPVQVVRTEHSDLGDTDEIIVDSSSWDEINRLTARTNNAGEQTRFAYDSRGNMVEMTDPRGNRTTRAYDGLSRTIVESRILTDTGDGGGIVIGDATTLFEYDDSSRLRAVTDDAGNVTRHAYDSLDRRIATQMADGTLNQTGTGATWPLGNPDPDLTFFDNGYDLFGNRATVVDARESTISSAFDALNRLESRSIILGQDVVGVTSETYSYDGLSRLVRAQDNDTNVIRQFDSLGNLRSESQQLFPNPLRLVQHNYNSVGERLSTTYPGGRFVLYVNDALGRIKQIADATGLIALFDYVGPFRLERRACTNNTATEYVYDSAQRPQSIQHTNTLTAQTVFDIQFTRDARGNKTSAFEPSVPYQKQHAFDSLDRLISTRIQDFMGPLPDARDYYLDDVGNRQFVLGNLDPGNYVLDPTLPNPADAQVHQYTQTPFDQRLYDDGGNLTRTQAGPTIRNFAYDYRNQMVQYLSGAFNGQYAYDALGRRIQKTGAGVPTTRFYYDGADLIEDQSSLNTTLNTYIHAPGSAAPVQFVRSGVRRFYHADDLGSVRKITDQNGNVVEQYRYEDFGMPSIFNAAGNPIIASQIGNPFLFHGRYWAGESLLLYCGNYLDPQSGRITNHSGPEAWATSPGGGFSGNYTCFGNPVTEPVPDTRRRWPNEPICCIDARDWRDPWRQPAWEHPDHIWRLLFDFEREFGDFGLSYWDTKRSADPIHDATPVATPSGR